MVYILNTSLRDSKKIRQELREVVGIGKLKANQICDKLGLNPNLRVDQLSLTQTDSLVRLVNQNYYIGSELKKIIKDDIKRLVRIGCYRGFRHVQKLPVRGQRTHTNAKTVKRLKGAMLIMRKEKIFIRKNVYQKK